MAEACAGKDLKPWYQRASSGKRLACAIVQSDSLSSVAAQ
jgi:hypothetical protein